MILEEIHRVMAEHHERTGLRSSIRQFFDGSGCISIDDAAAEHWRDPTDAEEVIRKALAPPPPPVTKEEVLKVIENGLSLCVDDCLCAACISMKAARSYIEAQGD